MNERETTMQDILRELTQRQVKGHCQQAPLCSCIGSFISYPPLSLFVFADQISIFLSYQVPVPTPPPPCAALMAMAGTSLCQRAPLSLSVFKRRSYLPRRSLLSVSAQLPTDTATTGSISQSLPLHSVISYFCV